MDGRGLGGEEWVGRNGWGFDLSVWVGEVGRGWYRCIECRCAWGGIWVVVVGGFGWWGLGCVWMGGWVGLIDVCWVWMWVDGWRGSGQRIISMRRVCIGVYACICVSATMKRVRFAYAAALNVVWRRVRMRS